MEITIPATVLEEPTTMVFYNDAPIFDNMAPAPVLSRDISLFTIRFSNVPGVSIFDESQGSKTAFFSGVPIGVGVWPIPDYNTQLYAEFSNLETYCSKNKNMHIYGVSRLVLRYVQESRFWENVFHRCTAALIPATEIADKWVATYDIDILPYLIGLSAVFSSSTVNADTFFNLASIVMIDYLAFTGQIESLEYLGRTAGQTFRQMLTIPSVEHGLMYGLLNTTELTAQFFTPYNLSALVVLGEYYRPSDNVPIIWVLQMQNLDHSSEHVFNIVIAHVIFRLGVSFTHHLGSDSSQLLFRPRLLHNMGAIPLEIMSAEFSNALVHPDRGTLSPLYLFYLEVIGKPMVNSGRLKFRYSIAKDLTLDTWYAQGMPIKIYYNDKTTDVSIRYMDVTLVASLGSY